MVILDYDVVDVMFVFENFETSYDYVPIVLFFVCGEFFSCGSVLARLNYWLRRG